MSGRAVGRNVFCLFFFGDWLFGGVRSEGEASEMTRLESARVGLAAANKEPLVSFGESLVCLWR